LEDLGGLEEDGLGDGEAERLGRLQVDDEVEGGTPRAPCTLSRRGHTGLLPPVYGLLLGHAVVRTPGRTALLADAF
jgi:hypothetical protein